jgi:hypothetical protein
VAAGFGGFFAAVFFAADGVRGLGASGVSVLVVAHGAHGAHGALSIALA